MFSFELNMAEAVAQDQGYRKISLEFLSKSGGESFDIYYKTNSLGQTKFVKFASSDPKHQEKVQRLLESGEATDDFYIEEGDLFKYYQHATQSLRAIVSSSKVPLQEKTKKVYDVSKNIMHEFFENNASSKILSASDEVVEVMESCFSEGDVGFYGISQITNKDYYTYTHSVNVGLYCMTYGIKIGMSHAEAKELGLGGMLHDVGKSKINEALINKNGKLTEEEFEEMKKHSPEGERMLVEMNCYGHAVIQMAGQHHEQWNGGGYPNNLVGEDIAMPARVCKVMDVYDALTTRRSYKKAMSAFDTLTLMKKQMASQFDPKVLDNFIRLMGPDL